MDNEIRCAIEFREDDSRASPGLLTGTLMQYEVKASDRPEVFVRGSLRWPESGVVLNLQHDRRQIVTRTVPYLDGEEVKISTPLPDTAMGRDVATLLRNGTLTGLSVEFRSVAEGRRGVLREIRQAFVDRAAIVDTPSYSQSTAEVRNQTDHDRILLAARLSL